MRIVLRCVALSWATVVALTGLWAADDPAPGPLRTGAREDVEIRLVLIDTVVVDRNNRTVSNLNVNDFEVLVDGEPRPINTLDVDCKDGAADDVRGVRHPKRRPTPVSPDLGRKIVLAVDYQHLSMIDVFVVLGKAQQIVENAAGANDEIMIAALIGGLRIEQQFSSDHEQVMRSLKRMQYDISLRNADYRHPHEGSFFTALEALLRVVGSVDGPKALVLFSNSPAPADEEDIRFANVAALASHVRCSIYSAHAEGLVASPP